VKYFLDTEFIESGRLNSIQLVSIGIVAEDGREYYAVSSEFNPNTASQWVTENVIEKLESPEDFKRKRVAEIAIEVKEFVGQDKPEFWGYYADYDWVVLAQMFGAMINLPEGWPMYCNDLKQLAVSLGNPPLAAEGKGVHNALEDARWNKIAYDSLPENRIGRQDGIGLIKQERIRQIVAMGFNAKHDNGHDKGQLSEAASCYVDLAAFQAVTVATDLRVPMGWPWSKDCWRPSSDPIRNLVKAGALIASEIDRLRRKREG
jgi:hypothetical protein